MEQRTPLLRSKLYWVAVLYFAEGLPFGIAYDVWPVYFRVHGVSLAEIGLMSLLSLPWTLKILWAPLVDRYGTRQHWISAALVALGVATLALIPQDASSPSWALWAVLLAFTAASATQDIVVDAFRVESLPENEQAAGMASYVAAYRIGMLVSTAGALFMDAVHKGGGRLLPVEKFVPAAFLDTLASERITRVGVVPTMMRALVLDHPEQRLERSALRTVMIGGESLGQALGETLRALFAPADLVDIYGLTETSTCDFFLVPRDAARYAGCIGRPSPGVRYRIRGEAFGGIACRDFSANALAGPPFFIEDPHLQVMFLGGLQADV